MSRSLRRRPLRAIKSHRNALETPQLVENLENRVLLVGQVQAFVSGNNLIIHGENSANQVEIAFHEGNVSVRPKQGTRINGQRGQFIAFENTDTVPGSILIDMQKGDDTVILSRGLKVQKDVYFKGREGNDTLGLDNAIIRDDLIFSAGVGDDNISIEDSRVVDDVSIRLHGGDDLVRVVQSEIRDDIGINGSTGADSVVFDEARVRGHVQLNLLQGDDIVDIRESRVVGNLAVLSSIGDDTVQLEDTTSERRTVVKLGAGDDEFLLGDGNNTTPATGNIFKNTFIAFGGSGIDNFQVDVDNEFRTARREAQFEGDTFAGSTAGAITAADAVRDSIRNFIDVELTANIDTSVESVIATGTGDQRLFTTTDETITITGTSDPSAELEVDSNGDGIFDDATGTADRDGTFSIDVPVAAGQQTIDIRNTEQTGESRQFEAYRAIGTVVRMQTSLGNVDIELLDDDAPLAVANFLSYLPDYGNELAVQRISDIGGLIIQAGGFTVDESGQFSAITRRDPIDGEFLATNSNIRGTLSMALPGDGLGGTNADGGTSEWFFNLSDDTAFLDDRGHTVFARVIGDVSEATPGVSMATLDAIGAVSAFDLSEPLNFSALGELPVQDLDATEISGTLTIAESSFTVSGTNTAFTSELSVGDFLQIEEQVFVVNTIGADDDLTLTTASSATRTAQTASLVDLPTNDESYIVFSDIAVILDRM